MMINNTGNNPGGSTAMNGSSNGVTNGFTPFPPRQQQPVTYTAGTFAQTKFGSTKLKSNGKKTNRMSPTEFSNYIKQRAMQKASINGCVGGPNMGCNPGNGMIMNHGGHGGGGPMSGGGGGGHHNQHQPF